MGDHGYDEQDRAHDTLCWIWRGQKTYGYGRIYVPGRASSAMAHRVYYERHVGPIPEGFVLHHLCEQRDCVNPDHLKPVTHSENVALGRRVNARKIVCKNGHRLTPANTYTSPKGIRYCRECRRIQAAAIRARFKEEAAYA